MTQWHSKSKKKTSGGLRTTLRRSDKKLVWKGGAFASTKVSEKDDKSVVVGRGTTSKQKLKRVNIVSVSDKKGRASKATIVRVLENPANRHFTRRDIVTRNAKIEIDMDGTKKVAVVKSRPGQTGMAQAVLLDETVEAFRATAEALKKKAEKKPSGEAKPAEDLQTDETKGQPAEQSVEAPE